MTIPIIVLLVLGVLGAIIGLPSSLALFLVGAERARDGAAHYAYTGLFMLMISVVGLLWIFLK